MEYNEKGLENLAIGMVKQACEDYMKIRIRLHNGRFKRESDKRRNNDELERTIEWFYGPQFAILTKIDPDYLLKKMDELLLEGNFNRKKINRIRQFRFRINREGELW